MMPDIETLYTETQIARRLEELAAQFAQDLPRDIMIVALLRGSFVFAADLLRAMHRTGMHPEVDFLTLASYGERRVSSGEVVIQRDIAEPVQGRDVLIIDDILESGRTLTLARDLLTSRGAASTRIAVLLEKPGKRAVQINADYVGFTIPDRFVVGYGLDDANRWRELPYIGAIKG